MINKIINYIDSLWITEQIWYRLSSKGKHSSNISKFLKSQIDNPLLDEIIVKNGFNTIDDDDRLIYLISKWVKNNIKYVSDKNQFNEIEHWSTVEETLTSMEGDCEDGAILIYVLARKCGIPIEKIKLIAGSVYSPFKKKIEGHAWTMYKSTKYPYVWFFIDWCYYFESKVPCKNRTSYIFDKDLVIIPYNGKYIQGWFVVDEEKGSKKVV